MKKPQLVKRLLAGSLVLALTVLDAAPAAAAEIQQPENIVEDVESLESIQAEIPEQESETAEANVSEAENEMPETETENEALQTENEALQAENQQAAADQVEASVTAEGEGSTFAVTPTPSITQPVLKLDEDYSYPVFYLSFTTTDCNEAKLQVTASNTGSVVYSNGYYESGGYIYARNFSDKATGTTGMTGGVTYTFTLTPFTYVEDEDGNETEVTGTPMSAAWVAPLAEAVTGLALKEMTPSGFTFSHSAVSENSSVYFEYSINSTFDERIAEIGSTSADTIAYYNMTPGVTYYVRAYTENRLGMKGAYSNVVSVKAPVAEVTDISTEVFDKAITLSMSAGYGDYTGFQIDRKMGNGKYQNIITTTERTFKDTGLQKDTKYSYRVRAYYYDLNTKKPVYGEYEYKTVETGTASMNLRAQATGKNTIKLTWKKVPGASGYDIYRYVTSSSSSTYKSGENYSFSKYEFIKNLGKKKKSFTNKKLVAGESYSYIVKAYKLVKGKKVYFTEDSASAETKFSFDVRVRLYKEAQNPKNGNVSIAWYQIPQAQGYLIERYDEVSKAWVTQKKITKAKTASYTLPAAPLGKTVEYRIRAYKNNKYSDSATVRVKGRLAAVSGVKATAAQSGIVVSWKPVAGASYYRVYRTQYVSNYNADTKTYDVNDYYYDEDDYYGSALELEAFKITDITDNYYYTLNGSATKMQKDYDTAKLLAYHRPGSAPDSYTDYSKVAGTSLTDYSYAHHRPVYNEQGMAVKENLTLYGPQNDVTYYYYVVAYAELQDPVSQAYYTAQSYGGSKPASAAIAATAAVKAPSIKAKAGKKSVTISYNKVAGASKYYIYRSTSKKGTYELVTVTTKTKYKDSKLTSKKTYYYKVKAVAQNSIGADKISGFSKMKSAKAK